MQSTQTPVETGKFYFLDFSTNFSLFSQFFWHFSSNSVIIARFRVKIDYTCSHFAALSLITDLCPSLIIFPRQTHVCLQLKAPATDSSEETRRTMPKLPRIDYYFDVISPYSYVGFEVSNFHV